MNAALYYWWVVHYLKPNPRWSMDGGGLLFGTKGHMYNASCPWCVYDDTEEGAP